MTALDIPEHLFTAIDHVGMAVPDLDEAIAFYRDTFGMTLAHEEVNEEQGVREAMMAVGDSGSCVQLLAPLNEESTIAKFIGRNGAGCQQIAYRVTDVEQVSAILRERGLRMLYDAPAAARPTRGSTSCTPRTPAASSSRSCSPPPTPTDAPRSSTWAPVGPFETSPALLLSNRPAPRSLGAPRGTSGASRGAAHPHSRPFETSLALLLSPDPPLLRSGR